VPASLRVGLEGASGVTRDVSASGIFFETDASYAADSSIQFTVDIETASGQMLLCCQGHIVRVERRGPRIGVAVRITESSIRPAVPAPASQLRPPHTA